jgi:hypothetical protein
MERISRCYENVGGTGIVPRTPPPPLSAIGTGLGVGFLLGAILTGGRSH